MASSLPQPTTPLSVNLETLSYINGMLEAFKSFDSNNDGMITVDELSGIMGSLGYNTTRQEIREMMSRGDGDGDGHMSAEEFLRILINTVQLDLGELGGLLETGLSALDADDVDDEVASTTVNGEKLYEALSCVGRLSMKDCLDIVASMDGDGDGAVDLDDLRLIVQALL